MSAAWRGGLDCIVEGSREVLGSLKAKVSLQQCEKLKISVGNNWSNCNIKWNIVLFIFYHML